MWFMSPCKGKSFQITNMFYNIKRIIKWIKRY
nr:MAG TPA: hypothetical protein [Caudoviricetes sp.]